MRRSRMVARSAEFALCMCVIAFLYACAEKIAAPPEIPAGPLTAVVSYCAGLGPSWAAFQDGDGAWTQALPNVDANGRMIFRRAFTTGRAGFATMTPFAGGALSLLIVTYGTPAELATAGDTNPMDCSASVPKTLFGDIGGLAANESAIVSSGNFLRVTVRPDGPGTFTLGGMPEGPEDLLATRTSGAAGESAVTRLILRRNIDVPDSTRLPLLDFGSAEAISPVTSSLTITGLAGDDATSGTRLRTSHSEMLLTNLTNVPSAATRNYFALPESALLAGDLQGLRVSANRPDGSSRSADLYFRTPVHRTMALGAQVSEPVVSAVATAPALRIRAQFAMQAEYDRATSIFYDQPASPALVVITMTQGYAAAIGGYDMIVPDFSAVAGFNPLWALRPGLPVVWSATRLGGSLGLGRDAVPVDGSRQMSAFLRGSFAGQ